ncbi:MAG: hypothetical protein NC548_33165 [Lachnospiraceae bacterium]|nr:hypothetical protein [Lachnospiraceae bacterium]
MEFVYRRIAGIEPIEAGFKRIRIEPNPCKGLAKLKADYKSVTGKIVSAYEQKNSKIIFTVEIPEGVEAEIVLPNEKPIILKGGTYTHECKDS